MQQPPEGRTLEQVAAEYERLEAVRAAAAQPSAREAQIAELRKHPATMDARHPNTMRSCSSS